MVERAGTKEHRGHEPYLRAWLIGFLEHSQICLGFLEHMDVKHMGCSEMAGSTQAARWQT